VHEKVTLEEINLVTATSMYKNTFMQQFTFSTQKKRMYVQIVGGNRISLHKMARHTSFSITIHCALVMPHASSAVLGHPIWPKSSRKKAIPGRRTRKKERLSHARREGVFIRLADIPVSRGWSGGDFCGHEYEMIDMARSLYSASIISGRAAATTAALIIDESKRASAFLLILISSGFDPGPHYTVCAI
jgi:hypothetical protein